MIKLGGGLEFATERELWYWRCSEKPIAPNAEGRKQFVDHQSRGIVPDAPDPYFEALSEGKRWWDVTVSFIRDCYFKADEYLWPGWAQLEQDYKHAPKLALQDIEKAIRRRKDLQPHRPIAPSERNKIEGRAEPESVHRADQA